MKSHAILVLLFLEIYSATYEIFFIISFFIIS